MLIQIMRIQVIRQLWLVVVFLVFNATFNNTLYFNYILAVILLVEETGVSGENH